jgi:serine/threonine protein kinase
MMNRQYSIGDTVLGNWTLVRLIGKGSYGRVFESERKDFDGSINKAAIKIITIPKSEQEVVEIRSEGRSVESVTAYFRSITEKTVSEISTMSKLKGETNIVSYEDHTVIPHDDGNGWSIIIRMQLLTALADYSRD